MKEFFHSKEEQKLFSGRDFYLEQLQNSLNLLKKSQHKNIAIFGHKGTGKSYLVKEFARRIKDKDVVPVYLDLNKLSLSPENLSVELPVNVTAWFFGKDSSWIFQSLSENNLKALAPFLKKDSSEIVAKIVNELEKIKPNQQFLIELAFNFVQALAEENGKKIILIIENFEKILDINGFEQISDVLFAVKFNQKDVLFAATSSAVSQFKPALSKYNFDFIELGNFSKEETKVFAEKIIGKVSNEYINEIYSLTYGHPAYVYYIAKRFKETGSVKRAFLIETLSREGEISRYCDSILQEAFSRARGKTLLAVILNILSYQDKLRLTEVARRIFRSAPVTKSLLSRLIEVDLISKADNLYSINDSVLRYFISRKNSGMISDSELDEEMLKKLEEEL